jgi:hypothetical protein
LCGTALEMSALITAAPASSMSISVTTATKQKTDLLLLRALNLAPTSIRASEAIARLSPRLWKPAPLEFRALQLTG